MKTKTQLKDRIELIIGSELFIWGIVYPKHKKILEKFVNRIVLELKCLK